MVAFSGERRNTHKGNRQVGKALWEARAAALALQRC